ncbi:MAG: hypothetical protein H8E27_01230 [Verrucomicrobia subdivision 3 bacterium]|nr:hypothetical protein [Limisphaerales bacterium]
MQDWILKLTGATVESGSSVVHMTPRVHEGVEWGWIFLLAVIFIGVVWGSYRWLPSELSRTRRVLLIGLRGLFIALLLGLLLRPVLVLTMSREIRRTLLVLVDSSQSMTLADPRIAPEDIQRAAIAKGLLDPTKGLSQPLDEGKTAELREMARTNVLRAVLQNERLNLLPALSDKFEVVPFTFGLGGQVRELPRARQIETQPGGESVRAGKFTLDDFKWVDTLGAPHAGTALGDSLREAIHRKRGQALAGVWVLTDGAHNSGDAPRVVAQSLRDAGVPVYFYGVGITSPRDIIIAGMEAPPTAFLEDELLVHVRVRSQGLLGKNGRLLLTLNGEVVAEETVAFGKDGEQRVPLRFKTNVAGEFDLRAHIAAREDETDPGNNEAFRRLRVVDDKIRVLFVEQAPRWDYRYLQAVLMRDRRVELKTLLLEGDPSIAQEENSPYLEKFPETKKDLFEYDVVVFGDVDPSRISTTQMENLNEFVSRFGGAFVMIAGRRYSPIGYADTPVADLLPVEFEPATLGGADPVFDQPIQVQLTPRGKGDPMLNLAGDGESNDAMWAAMPPIYWVAPVVAKPGATVLMVDPSRDTPQGKLPVMAQHEYGLGQVLYVGTDNTWRWRRNVGDRYYTRFWGQVNQRMAQQRFIGAEKRVQISLDSQNYNVGDRIRVYARLYQEGYEPSLEEVLRGVVSTTEEGHSPTEVPLKAVKGKPGLFFGEFVAPTAGQYQFHLQEAPDQKRDFTVAESSLEMAETAMNAKLMRDVAALTHGRFFREEDLHQLVKTIAAKPATVESRLELELWATPLYFLLILLVVTIEWVLRKWSYLK